MRRLWPILVALSVGLLGCSRYGFGPPRETAAPACQQSNECDATTVCDMQLAVCVSAGGSGEPCLQSGGCNPGLMCNTTTTRCECLSQAYIQCYDDGSGANRWWFDGCDHPEMFEEDCGGNGCSGGSCLVPMANVAVTQPPQGSRILNSDQAIFALSGTCSVGLGDVTITVQGSAMVVATVACVGGMWSASVDLSGLSTDGPVTLDITQAGTTVALGLIRQVDVCQNGFASLPFATASSGTASDPHLLCSVAHLRSIEGQPADSYYRLSDHITLGADFDDVAALLGGALDGDNLKIRDGSLATGALGLFGTVSAGAVVRNLEVDNVQSMASGPVAGALAGTLEGRVINCRVSGSTLAGSGVLGGLAGELLPPGEVAVSSFDGMLTDATAGALVGGIAGRALAGTRISGVLVNATIDAPNGSLGGLTARGDGLIRDSLVTGMFSAEDNSGGLVGRATGWIYRSHFDGTLSATQFQTGGLVGYADEGVRIIECSSQGSVSGGAGSIGGIGGALEKAHVRRSVSRADVTGDNFVGAIGGWMGASIRSHFSNVHAAGTVSAMTGNAGGLTGRIGDLSVNRAFVESARAGMSGTYGPVTPPGQAIPWQRIYVNESVSGSGTGGIYLTDVQAGQVASFVGLDFSADWRQAASGYPELRWRGQLDITVPANDDSAISLRDHRDVEVSGRCFFGAGSVSVSVLGTPIAEITPCSPAGTWSVVLDFSGLVDQPYEIGAAQGIDSRIRSVNLRADVCRGNVGLGTGNPGSGTPLDPFLICDAAQMVLAAAALTTPGHYHLGNDIDMSGTPWTPVAPVTDVTFDGRGHVISHLTVASSPSGTGLFSSVGGTSLVRDFVLDGAELSPGDAVGSGFVAGELVGMSRIERVLVLYSRTVFGAPMASIGGVVGTMNTTQGITACVVDSHVDSFASADVGGVAGEVVAGNIDTCTVLGDVRSNSNAGGIAGEMLAGTLSDSTSHSTVDGQAGVGGLIGSAGGVTIARSHSNGRVTGATGATVAGGGLVGEHTVGTLTIRYSSSQSVVEGAGVLGGLVGSSVGLDLLGSFSTGRVTGGTDCGGVLGTSMAAGTVTRVWSASEVDCVGTDVGGLAGTTSVVVVFDEVFAVGSLLNTGVPLLPGPATLTAGYYNTTLAGAVGGLGTEVMAVADMSMQATFAGFLFPNDWVMLPAVSEYPVIVTP